MERELEVKRKTLEQSRIELIIKFENQYIRADLLRLCRERFPLVLTSLSSFFYHLNPLYLLSNSLKPSFPTHSLQIHCIGFFGPKFIHHLCRGLKLRPYRNNLNIYPIFLNIFLKELIDICKYYIGKKLMQKI